MLNSIILDDRDQEYVVRAIDSSLRVTKKHHLFLWIQGLFHGLVPHDILVGLLLDETGKTIHVECITSVVLEGDDYASVCDPDTGLAVRLARHAHNTEARLLLLSPGIPVERAEETQLIDELQHSKLCSAMVHGRQSTRGGGKDYFVLFRQGEPLEARHGYFMQLLMPHLHSAFQRVLMLGSDDPSVPVTGRARKLLTERELEIMRWVCVGKSNAEIGTILTISQLTVKNHVQNILKKLKVQNRAQAVSKAIALCLLNGAI